MCPKSTLFQSPEVRVVEASAGSGKTFALAKRYVQLLLNPEFKSEELFIRSIFAATFTNKAALEMKSRILFFLKHIALERAPDYLKKEIITPLGLEPKEAGAKAFVTMEEIIRHYNFFHVQTLDKFINSLLSGCAFRVGLTANFRIKTNSVEYLERSVDELLDQLPKDKALARLFEEFLHNYLYLEGRTGWFPKKDILGILTTLYKQYNHYGRQFIASDIATEDLIKTKSTILKDIKDLREALEDGGDKRFLNSIDKFLKNNEKSFDVDNLSDYFCREAPPVRKDVKVSDATDKLWRKICKNIHDAVLMESISTFNPYINIFDVMMTEFNRLSVKDDVLFLEELNKRAAALFENNAITVEELYYRLATRFRHYLVDEFQDTSKLQWHNIETMAEEALSTGGTLFYVGDRKQAIYGFRGGDVRLFDQLKTRFNDYNVQEETLSENWRSQKEIVEFNNSIFSIDNLRRFIQTKEIAESDKNKKNAVVFTIDDYKDIETIYSHAKQDYQPAFNKGLVSVEYVDIDKKEERCDYIRTKLISTIKNLKKRFSYKDIAVLTRSNSEVEEVTSWLLEEKILTESERTLNIKENPYIQELIYLFKFLESPIDNLSFTQFILGDVFCKASGVPCEKVHEFVLRQRDRLKNEKDFYVYIAFREEFPQVWENYLEEFFKNVGLFPLYELLLSIYSRLGCLEHFPHTQGFFMHLLEIIKEQEDEFTDISSFLEYFENLSGEDLYVEMTQHEAIRILTVHKAKGLEFPVVIIPFLGMEVVVGATSDDNQQSYVIRPESEGQMRLLRLKSKYLQFADELYEMYKAEYKRSFLSELNNVYVALTRAQHELYAFIPKKISNTTNIVQFLIPEELYKSGSEHTYEIKEKEADNLMTLAPSKYKDWIDYLKDEFMSHEEALYRPARQHGESIHYALSFIKHIDAKTEKKILEEAIEIASHRHPVFKEDPSYKKTVADILAAKEIRIFFETKDAVVMTEKEFVNVHGHTKRVDRLIVHKEEVWIVDFKLTMKGKDDYESQMKEYMTIAQGLYPKHDVRGFLVALDNLSVLEIKSAKLIMK